MKKIESWFEIPKNSDFSIHNLPFGIFSTKETPPRVGVAIGNHILDLYAISKLGVFNSLSFDYNTLKNNKLNDFIALGKPITKKVRLVLQHQLCDPKSKLKKSPKIFISQKQAKMHLPIDIGDYTDFYSSIEHATNVGKMFRDPENALLPNWRHLPVGYHGRSSSIVVSETPVRRPKGQILTPGIAKPKYHPTQRLDFELEMAFIVGKDSILGKPIAIDKAENHIFGMVLFNDWSARDIQKWEYVPLGPFLGKSFASSISPWIVTMEAINPFRVKGPTQKPSVLSYLKNSSSSNFDINLEVSIKPKGKPSSTLTKTNFKYMYWSMAQQLTHHVSNGCNVKVGDIMASGTISGPTPDSFGSMLELAWSGTKPLLLNGGIKRTFIEDNDSITMNGFAESDDGKRVGFGHVSTKILPSI